MLRFIDKLAFLALCAFGAVLYLFVTYPVWTTVVVVAVTAVWLYGRRLEKERAAARLAGLPHHLMSPAEYEQRCADVLQRAGWRCRVVGRSGDQGADVVAERGGLRAVVQCKRYGAKTGNAAVQQVAAARQHYRANLAAVVAPSGYTRAAEQLADSCGVLLLHHDDLGNLGGLPPPPPPGPGSWPFNP